MSQTGIHLRGYLAKLGVHLAGDLGHLMVHRLLVLEHGVGELPPERLDLLLEERGGLIYRRFPRLQDEPDNDQENGSQ